VGPVYLWVFNAEQILHHPLRQLFFGNIPVPKNCYSNNYSYMKYNFKHDVAHLILDDKNSLKGLFNPLSPELNPICYSLALLAHDFLHVSGTRVKSLTLRLLISYIYGAPILDVSRSHTTTQHSR
jgi:hypothetical protein